MTAALLPRPLESRRVAALLARAPVVALLGPRQVGKTTLAGMVARGHRGPVHVFDLEDARARTRFENPFLVLEDLRGLVVLDEVQHVPGLFDALRVLADRPGTPARFLVLGSAGPGLLQKGADSLAGRIAYHDLHGLGLDEVGAGNLDRLWRRGGFPASFLASDEAGSVRWRQDLLRSFVQRDLPALGIGAPSESLRRFWTMLAHWHGQVWNGAELARATGTSIPTVKRWLDALESTYAVRVLRPWSENLAKRQVKSPKVFVADTGLLHALLGIDEEEDLLGHPKVGASWEGFAVASVARRLAARPGECHFWATHGGAALDLVVVAGRRRLGFEVKRTDAPSMTRSMRIAMDDLRLDGLVVVHAGRESFPLAERVRAVPLASLEKELEPLREAP